MNPAVAAPEWQLDAAPGGLTRIRFRAMASPCEVLIDGVSLQDAEPLAAIAFGEAHRVEQKWSRYRSDNLIHAINTAQGAVVTVDEETARLIDFGVWLYQQTEGRFDLTSGILRKIWRFDGHGQWPKHHQVRNLLPYVGWQKANWNNPRLQLATGMELDFGGIGKEYAVDRSLALLATACDAPLLVNYGGDLAANRPRRDGSAWQVGIDTGADTPAPRIQLRAGGVATSGDAHRYLMHKGRRHSHVLDARTGYPVVGAARCVTAAAANCSAAGALTTTAMLRGPDAEAYLKAEGVDYHVIR